MREKVAGEVGPRYITVPTHPCQRTSLDIDLMEDDDDDGLIMYDAAPAHSRNNVSLLGPGQGVDTVRVTPVEFPRPDYWDISDGRLRGARRVHVTPRSERAQRPLFLEPASGANTGWTFAGIA